MNDAALRWRLRRGTRELDIVLTRFYRLRYPELDAAGRRAFERLLACEDDQLWDWVTGRARPDSSDLMAVVDDLRGLTG